MISTKASAVSGPTPGCVIKRCASGHFSTSCSMVCVRSVIVGFSRSSNSSRSCRRRLAHGANRNASRSWHCYGIIYTQNPVGEGFTFEKLHDQIVGPVLVSDIVERADVGM